MELHKRYVPSAEFGEIDDPEWISLYPDERSLSPVRSPPRSVERSPEIQPASSSSSCCCSRDVVGLSSSSSTRVLRRKHANVVGTKQEERRRRVGKRKCFGAPEDIEEVRKLENLRHRKKAYVLEKKLGSMTSAIEELNSAINLIGTGTECVRSELPYAYNFPGQEAALEHKMSFPNEKPSRSKRKVLKRHGWSREMRRLKKPASVFLACLFCFIMLFFPIKLGLFHDDPTTPAAAA